MRRRERAGDQGFVTAESAMVLPVLVMFAMALVWGLLVVAAQIQCVDAARTGARAAARQDPAEAVVRVARDTAPRDAQVTVAREGDRGPGVGPGASGGRAQAARVARPALRGAGGGRGMGGGDSGGRRMSSGSTRSGS